MKNKIIRFILDHRLLMNILALFYSFPSILRIKGKKKNQIIINGAFLSDTKIHIMGKNNVIHIAPENRIFHCNFFINGSNCSIKIDKHCILSNLELWIEDNNGKIQIGYRTTIEGGHIAATEGHEILIGQDCMFSHDVVIRNGDSHSIFDADTLQRINSAKNVIIDDHVWLGEGVKVLKGSHISTGAIIATGAIVSGFIENNSIFAGIPAKKINEKIFWKRER